MHEGAFGYVAGIVPEAGADGKYQVPPAKVHFDPEHVAEDEIDLESGFIMMPQTVPLPAPPPATVPPPTGSAPTDGGAVTGTQGAGGTPLPPPGGPAQKLVEIAFWADRNQLFAAWNAVANLADLAGKVSVTLRAESEKGFERSKLQNGVFEPLKEANLME